MKSYISFLLIVITFSAFSQNVGISATSSFTPNVSAMLDIDVSSLGATAKKGLLIPRLALATTTDVATVPSPTTSLLVYNTATAGAGTLAVTPGFYFWDGTVWVAFSGSGGKDWSLLGNVGTVDGTNFLGTTDNVALNFRVNNAKAGRVDPLGPTFLGYQAGNTNSVSAINSTGIGYQALKNNTSGDFNTAIGNSALSSASTASYNTANGAGALYSATAGSNTASGAYALYYNTTGTLNTAFGISALQSNTLGVNNTANGAYALYSTTGSSNTASGAYALYTNAAGNNNTASGASALRLNTGSGNTGIGTIALTANSSGAENTAVGYKSLLSNTSGASNVGIGAYAIQSNTAGIQNTATGYAAMQANRNGSNNTADGYYALQSCISGSLNTAQGYQSLYTATGGSNTAVGASALFASTTGSFNVAFGIQAGNAITTGSNNIAIGYNAQVASATGSDQIRIGNTTHTLATTQVAWTTTSDRRWKSDIKNSELGLDFIKSLHPVSYTRKNDLSKKLEFGFIAQEIEETLNKFGATHTGIISKDDAGMYGVRYNDFMAPMVKAIQEQQTIIEDQKQRIDKLELMIKELSQKVNK